MKPTLLIIIIILFFALAIEAKTVRSHRAKAEFKRLQPCPTTGKSYGACPGWEIDHIEPLYKGGADTPQNMQWLETDQHRQKHRTRH
jgi:5-methylcytosine-specific restriction endonuclease McrA